jgi:Bacterial Ig-like domain (group 3)
MRRLVTGGMALAVVCGSLIPSAASAAGATATAAGATATALAAATGIWSNAQQVSGVAALNVGGAAKVSSVACPAAGECTALGYYSTNGSFNRLFVVSENHGTWGEAEPVPGLAGIDSSGVLACPSAGNCAIAGTYSAGSYTLPFVVDETNGVWSTIITIATPYTSTTLTGTGLTSLSCTSAGNCVAAGGYVDLNAEQALVVTETNGVWGAGIQVPGITALSVINEASQIESLSCSGPGDCAAGGMYFANSLDAQPFVVSETNGTWNNAERVPGLSVVDSAYWSDVVTTSCGSAGHCTAGGFTMPSYASTQGFVVSETNGAWSTVIGISGMTAVTALSCTSASNCTAAGGTGIDLSPLAEVARETNGTWGAATELPGVSTLAGSGVSGALALSCTSAGYCATGGDYSNSGVTQALVANEAGGSWHDAQAVPGAPSLNAGGSAQVDAVSCATAEYCAAGGYYTDKSGAKQAFLVNETPAVAATATTASLSAASVSYGREQAERVSVAVTARHGTPAGSVAVKSGRVTVCVARLAGGNGSCTVPATESGAGRVTLTATYGGAAGFASSTSSARTFTVTRASSTTSLTVSASRLTYGHEQAGHLTVRVTPRYRGTPTGTVTIKADGTLICTITLASGRGSCALTAKQLRAGAYTLIASYGADRNFTASASGKTTLTVLK